MLTRREFAAGSILGALTVGAAPLSPFVALERRSRGRLGVAALDLGSGARIGHRTDERFSMCSTFKAVLAAQVLAQVDRGRATLADRIVVRAGDLLANSPVTERHLGPPGMTLGELCEAAITRSDNAAANLLLARFGGPAGLTDFVRSLGDRVTRYDRNEPTLNEGRPGDPRDTSTPAATLDTWRRLLFGKALSPASRAQLAEWLVASKTGDARLRAGLPAGWRIGDKTGTGDRTTNDIAVVWPPDRAPLLIVAYLAEVVAPDAERNAVLAEVGRIVTARFA